MKDHDQIAENINDVVACRLFPAGLALQTALGLLDEHRAGESIESIQCAIDGLDQAVSDLRDIVFGTRRTDSRRGSAPG
jgi:signal transduction histidine kinase